MTKEQWKEELSGAVFSHEKTFDDTVYIKITDLNEKLCIGFLGNPFVTTWNEKYSNWILQVNCWYNTETGEIEYEGEVTANHETCYTNLDIDDVLQIVLDETVRDFWRSQKEKLKKVLDIIY